MGGDDVVEEWVIAIRICGAAALAAIVGFEREASKKPACVKMHMLVAASAATFVGVALLNTQKWQLGDVNRVAAGVASGVGFLGAGTIAKKEMQVSGLITAAGIWLVAGIGFAVANGVLVYWCTSYCPSCGDSVWILLVFVAHILERHDAKVPNHNNRRRQRRLRNSCRL
mmetsp:Transcript_11740/g.18066  ORF Transcript_11740/g.18066 Transcript_11740/m.18066 type:complete len:170 (-) Transcript_11740:210-719(-)